MIDKLTELVEITMDIEDLEPWKWLYDIDVIEVNLENGKEPYYCAIMGHNDRCLGISVYYGLDGYRDLEKMSSSDLVPPEYIMSDIDCWTCYFGKEDELDSTMKSIFEGLNRDPKLEDGYCYFMSFKKRFYPYQLNEEEVDELILVYKQLYHALYAYIEENRVDPAWEEDEIISISDNIVSVIPRLNDVYIFDQICVNDLYLEQLKQIERMNDYLFIDLHYMNTPINDPTGKYYRPINPLTFVALNAKEDQIIAMEVVDLEMDTVPFVFEWVTEYIEENGIPSSISFSNPYVGCAIVDLCEKLEIEHIHIPFILPKEFD